MKANKRQSIKGKWSVIVICAAVLLAGLFIGAMVAYNKLRELYLEQCVIVDVAAQVRINSGKMVKAGVVAEEFGLRDGANLGMIDYDEKRRAILKKIPNIRSIQVTRHLPDKVTIRVEERRPEARINVVGVRKETVRVADSDGMVFRWQRDTAMLPVILEARGKVTAIGNELTGRALAALRLLEVAKAGDDAAGVKDVKLGIWEVDASHPDYLCARMSDYSKLKIAWDGMDNPTESNLADLEKRLRRLRDSMKVATGVGIRVWNVTLEDRVFADRKEPL